MYLFYKKMSLVFLKIKAPRRDDGETLWTTF